jgi:hypothetical protein
MSRLKPGSHSIDGKVAPVQIVLYLPWLYRRQRARPGIGLRTSSDDIETDFILPESGSAEASMGNDFTATGLCQLSRQRRRVTF